MKDLHLVMRTAGERTTAVSKELAKRCGLTEDDITVISEVPFESALRATYETGIRAGKKWTMTLDADVLLSDNAISGLIEDADMMPSNYVQLEGRILDKITGLYRQAGHRIYRTELLPSALRCIPGEGKEIRPEYFTLQQLGRLGYPSRRVSRVVGLHDYEQYYVDLYRKSFVHTKKHSWLVGGLIERCARFLQGDTDFLVILKGLWDGLVDSDIISIDKRRFLDSGLHALEELGIEEKGPLTNTDLFMIRFPQFYSEIVSACPVHFFGTQDDPPAIETRHKNWFANVLHQYERLGPLKGSAAIVGALLKHIGQYMNR